MSDTKKFKRGDKVIAIKDTPSVVEGWVGYVVETSPSGDIVARQQGIAGVYHDFKANELELLKREDVQIDQDLVNSPKHYSVLEERKADKIRMELVDQGFPLAFLEIAKVMTWANKNKGYKDHDWKQIPDAENAFKGAAARHRVKFDAQRSFGMEMLSCTDEESAIIHLAHECFNNLALLELALSGKIK